MNTENLPPWIDYDHRCEHRAAAADRKLMADEWYRRWQAEQDKPQDEADPELWGLRVAHELMARQFRIMQQEKEHGWHQADRWESRFDRLKASLQELAEELVRDAAAYRDVGPANDLDPESCALIAEDAADRLHAVIDGAA